ncbi:ABC transporter ATP-binding protein [Methylobacterium sp. E-045]|uniref:ABC transporter ATP-binding protein n=1 Tax=Methylobacterium sp. E-045 TaxID=2836575 RepID=UPI001FBB4EAA|nr:ABC transporter ATP-binding protein [Methylobacterium sp. E-045]MCJ2131714.1 ABC transporter ATP-binding protein [Methylobacterium sp. E-045]
MPLSCTNLRLAYGRHTAIAGVSLALRQGAIHALIGPNGSGKSTLLHALAGLITPNAGTVEIHGRPLRTIRRRALAQRLAFLPQQPIAPEEMTVERLVLQGRFAHVGLLRGYRPVDIEAVQWALESTGLAALAARPLHALSGGERQRAWIATALAQEADILLLDEPTSFLDIGHQVEILNLLLRLSRERGITVAMAIHDIDQAMAVADRIVLLDTGRLMFEGTANDLAVSGLVEQAFRVTGRFVQVEPSGAWHLDLTLDPTAQAHRLDDK